jgi:hypothetical protein
MLSYEIMCFFSPFCLTDNFLIIGYQALIIAILSSLVSKFHNTAFPFITSRKDVHYFFKQSDLLKKQATGSTPRPRCSGVLKLSAVSSDV